ncbi:uncharacterized protein TA07340 [Theileria annulata]|uniref:EF-hand domain-containing protein n=1 Tax=Theileria annulata TaxID=5874 RepID=Q4UA77_THEAN|nr:uncharacterized protein TA07340 [Theileria annulata]CAI76276.1 hypothetical protein, conserved [Theileria annulata]|eukprot:XP_952900.1 hypothetical protein, conserved [Theileria annulata]
MEEEKKPTENTESSSSDYFEKSIAEHDQKTFTHFDYPFQEEEDSDRSNKFSKLGKPFKFIFPDKYPLSWFGFHLFLIGTFFFFKCNAPDKNNVNMVLGSEHALGGLVSMIFIFSANALIHIAFMFIRFFYVVFILFTSSQCFFQLLDYITCIYNEYRYLLVNCILDRVCSRNPLSFALLNMLDPTLFYTLFASFQSMLWQVLIFRNESNDSLYYIDVFKNTEFGNIFVFDKSSMVWISYGVYLYVILSIRCLLLSVITFLFELGFLMSSNDSMKKYLDLYTKIRRFNILWISYSLTKPNLIELIESLNKYSRFEEVGKPKKSKHNDKLENAFKDRALEVLKDHNMTSGHFQKTARSLDLPTHVTESLINSSTNSRLKNWMLAYYVTKTSPCISLLHQDVVLKNENMINKVSEVLFDQIYATTNDYKDEDKMDSETMDNNYTALVNSDSCPAREDPKKKVDINITNIEELPVAIINTAIDLTANTAKDVKDTAKELMGLKEEAPGLDRKELKERISQQIKHRKSSTEPQEQELRPSGSEVINIGTPSSMVEPRKSRSILSSKIFKNEFKSSKNKGRTISVASQGITQIYDLRSVRETLLSEDLNIQDVINFRGPEIVDPKSSYDYIKTPIKYRYDRNDLFISRERLALFIPEEDLDKTINLIDISGHGRINFNIIKQALTNLFSSRKKFKRNLKGQQSVFRVVKRLISAVSWIISFVILSFMAGVKVEAIVVSGAAFLSALTVALSYMYTNFITSVIFVAFSNPYNVGDRVRLDNGEPLIVKKIRTYTTEFVSIHGKILIYQNSLLSTMKITNESRSETATLEIVFKIDDMTSDAKIEKLNKIINTAINCRPNDFVKDSAGIFGYHFFPGHCYEVALWLTCIESWGNWQRVYQLRTEVLQLVVRVCKELGIGYTLPTQPLHFKDSLEIASLK